MKTEAAKATQALEILNARISGASYDVIANNFKINKLKAYQVVAKELEKIKEKTQETAEEILQLELMRLDRMLFGVWKDARSGNVKAIGAVLKLMERRAKLLGLDKPTNLTIDGNYHDVTEYQITDEEAIEEFKARGLTLQGLEYDAS